MEITASLVKELRERTWIGMMECKKALLATWWDIELAIEELRKKWLAKAASKADREALEWAIKIVIRQNKAYVVSVSCETDFLANSDRFQDMLNDLVSFLEAGKSIEEAKAMIDNDYSLEMWEKLEIKKFEVISWQSLWAYVHSNKKLAALVVSDKDVPEEKLKQVAMHIVASNPEFLRVSDISEEVLEKERSIQLEIMKNDPKMAWKPDNVLLQIIEWKMKKFASEIALLEQDFVVNPSLKVKDFIWEDTISVFYKYSI